MTSVARRQSSRAESIKKRLNGFFFASPFSNWLWNTSVSHSWRCIRLTGMLLISIILTVRSYRLYIRYMAIAPSIGVHRKHALFFTFASANLS